MEKPFSKQNLPGIHRRKFFRQIGAVSAGGVMLGAKAEEGTKAAPAIESLKADVLIVGGGTAGTIAAIQAARLGVQTVLVEAGSQLGGTTTTAGVDFPGLFHAWGRQVIAGIGWELVSKTVELNGDRMPSFTHPPLPGRHWMQQVHLSGPLYAAIAEEACVQARVQLRYYESPLAVEPIPSGWKVRLAGKGSQVELTVSQIVDCTGNAAVVGLAGLPRLREESTQPGTLIYRLTGYDLKQLDLKDLAGKHQEALELGKLLPTDTLKNIAGFLRAGGENAMHVPGADSTSSVTHTAANLLGRQSLLRVLRFLKAQPGFETLHIDRLQPETGIRETYRIEGETMVTLADYTQGRRFEDAVAYSFYPIDLHDLHGVKPQPLAEGVVPTIPLGALIPKSSRNLMVAGRCLGSDRLANSALRVQASCMAMGQAAGVTAALAAQQGVSPRRVALGEIRQTLAKHAAIVPA